MASLRWIAGLSCLMVMIALSIGGQMNGTKEEAAQDSNQRIVTVRMFDLSTGSPQTIASPQLITEVGREFSCEVTKSSKDVASTHVGTVVTGMVKESIGGLTPVSLTIAFSDSENSDSPVKQAGSESYELDFELELPGSKTIELGSGRHCEVIIR